MSLGGQDDAGTQQLVYGPDGQVYGSPAQARAAGVNQYYREDGRPYPTSGIGIQNPTLPPDFIPLPGPVVSPISTPPSGGIRDLPPDFIPLPGPVVSPMPNPPSGGKGGADPYSQIMGQMGYGSDPYSQIMSQMPVRQNPYAYSSGGAIGGYDPSLYNNAFAGSNSRLNLSGLLGGGGSVNYGDGGTGVSSTPGWESMTPAQQAGYYAANPTMATITQMGQGLFGKTSLGALQNYFNPGFVSEQGLIAMGVDPAAYQNAIESFRGSEIAAMNAGYPSAQENNIDAGMAVASDAEAAAQEGNNVAAGIAAAADAEAAAADAAASGAAAGGDGGDGVDGYAKGGKVTKDRLNGPDPKGPDEGYGALLSGEYVIKKSAVKKYGQGLLDMINDGKIPAKKMKSLLG